MITHQRIDATSIFLFWRAVATCCAQAAAQHFVLRASPAYVWPCTIVMAVASLLVGETATIHYSSRIAIDATLDIFGLLIPAAILYAYPCTGSLALVTAFRSLALVLVALLKRTWSRLPEAVAISVVLALATSQRAIICDSHDSVWIVFSAMVSSVVATAVHAVRQEKQQTWTTTNLVRLLVLAIVVVLTNTAPGYDEWPLLAFSLYTALSIAASRSVLAYNAAVKQDAYFKTRMLSVRRIITATVATVLLEHYEASTAVLIVMAAAIASFFDFIRSNQTTRRTSPGL